MTTTTANGAAWRIASLIAEVEGERERAASAAAFAADEAERTAEALTVLDAQLAELRALHATLVPEPAPAPIDPAPAPAPLDVRLAQLAAEVAS